VEYGIVGVADGDGGISVDGARIGDERIETEEQAEEKEAEEDAEIEEGRRQRTIGDAAELLGSHLLASIPRRSKSK